MDGFTPCLLINHDDDITTPYLVNYDGETRNLSEETVNNIVSAIKRESYLNLNYDVLYGGHSDVIIPIKGTGKAIQTRYNKDLDLVVEGMVCYYNNDFNFGNKINSVIDTLINRFITHVPGDTNYGNDLFIDISPNHYRCKEFFTKIKNELEITYYVSDNVDWC